MKKFISIALILTILFAFSACMNNQSEDPTSDSAPTQIDLAEFGTAPTIYATVSNTNPAIGEEVIVTVRLCNAGLFSSIDLTANYDSNALSVEYTYGGSIPDIVDSLNVNSGKISYGGFVMRSANVTDEALFELTVTPQPGATGTQTIQFTGVSFLMALDANGNQTVDKTNQLQMQNITLNIQ